MTTINREGWLAALATVQPVDDQDALTKRELMVLFGLKDTTVKKRIQMLIESGAATLTHKRTRDAQGRQITVAAYRLVQPKEGTDGAHRERHGRRRNA